MGRASDRGGLDIRARTDPCGGHHTIHPLERAKEMTEQEANAAYTDFVEPDLYLHPWAARAFDYDMGVR